jgi:hypothetical protein
LRAIIFPRALQRAAGNASKTIKFKIKNFYLLSLPVVLITLPVAGLLENGAKTNTNRKQLILRDEEKSCFE